MNLTNTHTPHVIKGVILHWKVCFLPPMHHSWSFPSVLIILWRESPAPHRSHSTAAALLHSRSTAKAIIGRRGKVAQLTMLIPGARALQYYLSHCPVNPEGLLVKYHVFKTPGSVLGTKNTCHLVLADVILLQNLTIGQCFYLHTFYLKSVKECFDTITYQ